MAVYVIMSFDDDDDAKLFVKDVLYSGGVKVPAKNYAGMESIPDDEWPTDTLTGAYVENVFKKPRRFCDTTDGHRKGKRISGWLQGKKWGWWVCGSCGLPSAPLGGPHGSSYAFNLLPVDAILGQGLETTVPRPEHLETPEGWTMDELT